MDREVKEGDWVSISNDPISNYPGRETDREKEVHQITFVSPNKILFNGGQIVPHRGQWIIPERPELTLEFYSDRKMAQSDPLESNIGNVKIVDDRGDLEIEGSGCAVRMDGRSSEDRYLTGKINGVPFYVVFDGHGGSDVVEILVAKFPEYLARYLYGVNWNDLNSVKSQIQRAVDRFEADYILRHEMYAGSTMVLALLPEDYIYLANLGDSVALVFDQGGQILIETEDHHPAKEINRITAAGGLVRNNRVNGNLAVSRAFGDLDLKYIENEYSPRGPVSLEINCVRLEKSPGQTLMLFSDGLTEQNLIFIAENHPGLSTHEIVVKETINAIDFPDACETLIFYSQASGSTDDITIIIVEVN